MDFSLPYASKRPLVFARNLVATSNPLAVTAGISTLQKGGNAVDAAIAAAMTLTVVEPTMNGIGGDAFALLWDGHKLVGLNASGYAPKAWTPEFFNTMGGIPARGWHTVTIPGGVSAWGALSKKFGKLSLVEVAKPAIEYAVNGFPVSPITAKLWGKTPKDVRGINGFDQAFFPGGHAPKVGEIEESLIRSAHPKTNFG